MVLKKSNCDVNSGNTLRPRYFNACCKPKQSAEHWIIKFYFNSIIQPVDFKRQNEEILAAWSEYIEDGDMEIMKEFSSPVVLSMNKLKRWLVPEMVKNNITSTVSLQDENFKVTLCEYEQGGTGYIRNSRGNCVGYCDSQYGASYITPHKSHSYLTDLRESGKEGNRQKPKPSRRRKYHNQHKWGIQRPERRERNTDPETPRQNIARPTHCLAERHGCPEIRYEVIRPAEFNSDRRNYLHYCSKKWEYWYYSPDGRSLRKTKGFRNKPNFSERVWGYNVLEMHEDAELAIQFPNLKGKERMCQKANMKVKDRPKVKERKTSYEVSFESLVIRKQLSKRRKKGKKSKNCADVDGGGYVFVDLEKKVQVKVKVELISRASSLWTKKYGKGCAVIERTYGEDEEQSRDDFVMVEQTDRQTDSENQLTREVLELLKSSIQTFNDSFCVCKMFMSDIMPRKLVELCGSKVEVSLIHPYTFVLDLDQWCLVCQISPGLGLWPDPESQNVVTVRLILQGASTESFRKYNAALHKTVQEDAKYVYTLKQLLDTAKEIIKDNQKEHSIQTKTVQAGSTLQKTVFKQLFAELAVVKTAQAIHQEYQQSRQILPSVARIDILDLIDLDLGLVEECAICFASWDGDKWSWVSHNMTLLPCQHSFCRQCWQIYLCHNIRQGKTTLLCMEYGCKTEIDATTVASLVPPELLTRWQHQCDEEHVAKEGGWEWCPRPGCLYLAKHVKGHHKKSRLQGQYGFTVKCHCGMLWCHLCKKEPHWPALCSHSNMYHKMLVQKEEHKTVDQKSKLLVPVGCYSDVCDDISQARASDTVTYFVNVKRCPQCKHPMEKNGGCSHMRCRCSFSFCWECLGAWNDHISTGLVCGANKKEETTMELDNSLNLSLPVCYYKDSVTHRHAWQHLSLSAISKRASHFVTLQRSTRQWTRNLNSLSQLDATQMFVRNTLMFVRDVHMLLENCSVLLSNTTRSCRPPSLVACRAQLAFINTRIEATLNMPKGQRDKMLTRLKSLIYMAWSTIDKLVLFVPQAQSAIDSYTRERTQDRAQSGLGADNSQ